MKAAADQPRLIHIYTGPSKGKTTASVGLAVRAVGADWNVLYCSFFKPDGSSEHKVLEALGVTLKRFAWRGTFFKKYTPEEMKEQHDDFKKFLHEIESEWKLFDLVVMDEVVYAITSGITTETEFLAFLDKKPRSVELVMTGRDYPESIRERANYITTMEQTKHPFSEGFLPRKGVEF